LFDSGLLRKLAGKIGIFGPTSSDLQALEGTPERLVRVGCPAHNCGGRCLLIAHVKDGVITRLDADDRPECCLPRSCAPACADAPICTASTTPTGLNIR
jgi:hypothetical protein